MKKLIIMSLTISLAAMFLTGCGKQVIKPESIVDQPEIHINTGFEMLDRGEYKSSAIAFSRAVGIDDTNPISLCGKGLALILANRDSLDVVKKLVNRTFLADEQFGMAFLVQGFYQIPENLVSASIENRLKDATDKARESFKKALKYGKEDIRLKYYAAIGYERILDFEQAKQIFSELAKEGPYISVSNDHLKLINNLQRLAPTTELGLAISLIEEVSRAEAAALICLELKPGRYLEAYEEVEVPMDMEGHWAALYAKEALQLGLMEITENGFFTPNGLLKRNDYALIYLRLMIGFSNDPSIAIRYLGSEVGYSDLSATNPAYTAARITVDNGLLQAENGYFSPNKPVSGVQILEMTSWLRKNYERSF